MFFSGLQSDLKVFELYSAAKVIQKQNHESQLMNIFKSTTVSLQTFQNIPVTIVQLKKKGSGWTPGANKLSAGESSKNS